MRRCRTTKLTNEERDGFHYKWTLDKPLDAEAGDKLWVDFPSRKAGLGKAPRGAHRWSPVAESSGKVTTIEAWGRCDGEH